MRRGISTILVISLTVSVMAGLAAGGWYYLDQKNQKNTKDLEDQISSLNKQVTTLKTEKTKDAASTTTTGSSTGTASESNSNTLKTYTSSKYGYSFQYPSALSMVDWYWNGQTSSRVPQEGKVVWLSKTALSENAIPMDADPISQYFSVSVSDETCGLSALRGDGTGVVIDDAKLDNLYAWKVRVTDNTNVMSGQYTTTYHANKGDYCYHVEIVNSDAAGTHDKSLDDIVTSFKFK